MTSNETSQEITQAEYEKQEAWLRDFAGDHSKFVKIERTELESLKSQLAEYILLTKSQQEAMRIGNSQLEIANGLAEANGNERNEALKANHALREALKSLNLRFIELSRVTSDNGIEGFCIKNSDDIDKALSTPKIEGLVVCKDEPFGYELADGKYVKIIDNPHGMIILNATPLYEKADRNES